MKFRVRIANLFYQCEFNDTNILFALKREEYFIDKHALKQIQLELDIIRRIFIQNVRETDERFKKIVQEEIDKDIVRNYERDLLYYHFQSHEHIVSRYLQHIL